MVLLSLKRVTVLAYYRVEYWRTIEMERLILADVQECLRERGFLWKWRIFHNGIMMQSCGLDDENVGFEASGILGKFVTVLGRKCGKKMWQIDSENCWNTCAIFEDTCSWNYKKTRAKITWKLKENLNMFTCEGFQCWLNSKTKHWINIACFQVEKCWIESLLLKNKFLKLQKQEKSWRTPETAKNRRILAKLNFECFATFFIT